MTCCPRRYSFISSEVKEIQLNSMTTPLNLSLSFLFANLKSFCFTPQSGITNALVTKKPLCLESAKVRPWHLYEEVHSKVKSPATLHDWASNTLWNVGALANYYCLVSSTQAESKSHVTILEHNSFPSSNAKVAL